MVARGFTQAYDINYTDMFSPLSILIMFVCCSLLLLIKLGLFTIQIDFNAFYGDLEE